MEELLLTLLADWALQQMEVLLLQEIPKAWMGMLPKTMGENDLWILKTDAEGNVLFEKSFGGADLDFGFDALEDNEGNLILVGESSTALSSDKEHQGSTDLVILKIK